MNLHPATKPTMYFIGVTTGQSSVNRIFPRWAEVLGLSVCMLRELDFKMFNIKLQKIFTETE